MNIYNPSNDDFSSWIKSDEKWPDSDWDYYVTSNGLNDDLLLTYANDPSCSKRDFCIHCLYYMVGEYFQDQISFDKSKLKSEIGLQKINFYHNRITHILDKVNSSYTSEILEWKFKSEQLLSKRIEYNAEFWFNFMFQDDDIG